MRIGLVLEGGAMRGMFTAGVLDVLMENNIEADCVAGVSAGALFGVNYLSGQKGRAIRYNKRFNQDKNYMGIRPFLREGNLVSTEYAYKRVPEKLDPFDDESFKASSGDFYAVVTNVENGQAEYLKLDSVFEQMDVLRASGSMPLVSKAVPWKEKKYLDGGISDSIPFEWMAKQGVDKIIVVLTQDATYQKKKMAPAMIKLNSIKYPAIAKRLSNRHNDYNEAVALLKEWEKQGKAFVICPSVPMTVNKLERNPDKLEEVYQLGRRDAYDRMEALKKYLE